MRSRRPMLGVTLKMVAERAGVSTASVSYILRGQGRAMRLSEACERKVRSAAQELGYHGNYHARSLLQGRSTTIGLVMGGQRDSALISPFWAAITAGVESGLLPDRYELLMINGRQGECSACELGLRHLRARRIDGLVVYRLLQRDIPDELLDPALPVVFIESHDRTNCNRVNFDPEPGLRAAVAHLAELGHREIATITVSRRDMGRDLLRDFDFPDRLRMARQAAQEHGLVLHETEVHPRRYAPADAYDTYSVQALQRALEDQLALPERATAILANNDDLALALYHLFAKRGIRVPQDISVVGFDDMYAANVAIPALTTVSHALLELGRTAGEQAIALVDAPKEARAALHARLPSRLVVRASTAPPPASAR